MLHIIFLDKLTYHSNDFLSVITTHICAASELQLRVVPEEGIKGRDK